MSVITHQSSASDTYHEVRDLLKGIFKVPDVTTPAPAKSEIQPGVKELTPGDKTSLDMGSLMNEISRDQVSVPLPLQKPGPGPTIEHVSPRKPNSLDKMLAAQALAYDHEINLKKQVDEYELNLHNAQT